MRQPCTTPVPNVILDTYLKELNSAELKVLLVVIRQTLGWVDRRGMFGRKETDWISGKQLKEKTGNSKRAITSAIDVLVRKKVIEILDEDGNILDSPEKRQGKTKLFYRLDSYGYNSVENTLENIPTYANFAEDISKKVTALVQKMHITKETLQN
jgi:hypothetical protein